MRKTYLAQVIITLFILNIILIYSPENITRGTNVSGFQNGIWKLSKSPYIVSDNVTIDFDTQLEIEPGVQVKFNKNAIFHVQGKLFANGTELKPIIFKPNTNNPETGYWRGIKYEFDSVSTVLHCQISYAIYGIKAISCYGLLIQDSEIYNCGNGTEFISGSNSTIERSKIYNNINNGINSSGWSSSFEIFNNEIYNNDQGINFNYSQFGRIENNTIHDNNRGIVILNSENSFIKNNIIYNTNLQKKHSGKWNREEAAIYLDSSSKNKIINNTITDTYGFGLNLYDQCRDNLIMDNHIERSSEVGINLLVKCTFNEFENNTMIDINRSSIALDSNCKFNTFNNNSIIKYDDRFGVRFGKESYWNFFTTGNRVNDVPLRIYYGEKGEIITKDLSNSIITEPLMTNLGQLLIIESTNFSISNVRLGNGTRGIFFYDAHNGTVINSVITNNKYGIYSGYNTSDIIFINGTIEDSEIKDIFLDRYSEMIVLNTTFNKSKIEFRYHSNLTVQWYLHVKVIQLIEAKIILMPWVDIYVFNEFDELVYHNLSNNKGIIKDIPCTELIKNDQGVTLFDKYNVTVIKMNHQPGYTGDGVLMDATKWVTIELTMNHDPVLLGSTSPAVTHNRTPIISWPAGFDTDNDVLTYHVTITNSRLKEIIENNSISSEPKFKVKTNLTYGERYQIKIRAFDPYGGVSNNITGFIDVSNNIPSLPTILLQPKQSISRPSKNEDLVCNIIKQSIDHDLNPKDKVKYNFQWFRDGILEQNLSLYNTTRLFHILPKEYTHTKEVWTCEVTAIDGIGKTKPVSDSRIIRNVPPRVIKTYPILRIYEDTVDDGSINLSNIFKDDDKDTLNYSYSITGDNISIRIEINGMVRVAPNTNWNGYEIVNFYGDDGESTAQIITKIEVIPLNDPPIAEILLPINNTPIFEELQTEFIGRYDDPDLIFGDQLNFTWISNISGVFGHSSSLNQITLPFGHHRIHFLVRDMGYVVVKDYIDIFIFDKESAPKNITRVKLLTPWNGQVFNVTTVTLSWSIVDFDVQEHEGVLFDVYFYIKGGPQQVIISKYIGTNLTLHDLQDNSTYYWTIVPFRNNTQGWCIDGIWDISINKKFIFKFGLELNMSNAKLILKTNEIIVYNFTLKNIGNMVNNFLFTIKFLNNSNLINYTNIEFNSVILPANRYMQINLTFNLSSNYTIGNDIMIIEVQSIFGNISANLTRNITIMTGKIPPLASSIDESAEKIPQHLLDMIFWIFSILIVIIILVTIFIILIVILFKRQGKMFLPIKVKTIIRRERRAVMNDNADVYDDDDDDDEISIELESKLENDLSENGKLPTAKPVGDPVKTTMITAVTPVRITPSPSKSKDTGQKKESKETEIIKEE